MAIYLVTGIFFAGRRKLPGTSYETTFILRPLKELFPSLSGASCVLDFYLRVCLIW